MKHNRYLFLIIISLFSITVYAQKNKNIVTKNKLETAEIFANNSRIIGYEYNFPGNVYYFKVNPFALMSVNVKTNGFFGQKSRMFIYDLQKDTLLWKIKNTSWDKITMLDNDIVFGIRYMDLRTGNIKYYLPNDIFFIDTVSNSGLGYKFSNPNVLMAVSLETGKPIWHKNQEYAHYEKYTYYTDTSLFLVSNSGLHLLDLKTGNGWDLKKKSSRNSKEEIAKTAGLAALSVLAGIFTGFVYIPAGETSFRDIKSNALIESDLCYFASNDGIEKIDIATGNVIWSTNFEKNSSSKSQLFEYEDNIYMLNFGYAYLNNAPAFCGTAFIAGYDKLTGQQTFIHYFNKKEVMLNYCTKEDYICINIGNRLYKFSFDDNSLIEEQLPLLTPEARRVSVHFIAENQYFIDDNGTFVDLSKQDFTSIYFLYDRKIYEIDEYFGIETVEEIAKIYALIYETADYKFICDGNITIMLDNVGTAIAEIYTSSQITIKNDIIYYAKENSVYAIKLSDILDN